jgi:RNA 2',3'-cyclic 3'-phosphodiesterase
MPEDPAAPEEAKPLRLFAAVEIPQRTKDQVERAIAPLHERYPQGKWVRPENWHVTVKFLGRTMPAILDRVRDACVEATARVRPFRVGLRPPGVFPRPTGARVLWVGLRDEGEGLAVIARALDRELAPDFPVEKRAFTAHLTVARFDPRVRIEPAELDAAAPEPSPFRVGELVLFRSHLSPKGARYEPLERFALRG